MLSECRNILIFACFLLVAQLLPSPILAQEVREVAPADIQQLVTDSIDGKPLVIHYTSDDGSCGPCIENNALVASAAERLSDNFDFVSVTMNPWRAFFESEEGKTVTDFQTSRNFDLTAVPAVMVYIEGDPVQLFKGANPSLETTLGTVFEIASDQALVVRGDIAVANIPPSQMATYVSAFSADKPLLLTLSSTDENCPFCLEGNTRVDDVSRYLSDDYVFARVDYDPWQSVAEDTPTAAFLEQFDTEVSGLPTSLLFYRGKLLGTVRTNGRDLRTVLSQALPTIKGADN